MARDNMLDLIEYQYDNLSYNEFKGIIEEREALQKENEELKKDVSRLEGELASHKNFLECIGRIPGLKEEILGYFMERCNKVDEDIINIKRAMILNWR